MPPQQSLDHTCPPVEAFAVIIIIIIIILIDILLINRLMIVKIIIITIIIIIKIIIIIIVMYFQCSGAAIIGVLITPVDSPQPVRPFSHYHQHHYIISVIIMITITIIAIIINTLLFYPRPPMFFPKNILIIWDIFEICKSPSVSLKSPPFIPDFRWISNFVISSSLSLHNIFQIYNTFTFFKIFTLSLSFKVYTVSSRIFTLSQCTSYYLFHTGQEKYLKRRKCHF